MLAVLLADIYYFRWLRLPPEIFFRLQWARVIHQRRNPVFNGHRAGDFQTPLAFTLALIRQLAGEFALARIHQKSSVYGLHHFARLIELIRLDSQCPRLRLTVLACN